MAVWIDYVRELGFRLLGQSRSCQPDCSEIKLDQVLRPEVAGSIYSQKEVFVKRDGLRYY